MKFPKIHPVLYATIHTLTFVGVLTLLFAQMSERERFTSIECDFFVQIEEWQGGHCQYLSPDLAMQNEQGAKRIYDRVIQAELGLCCEEGLCLDSAAVKLFKSCPNETSVDVLKDTIIYY